MAGKKGMQRFPRALKERAVRMFLEEGLSRGAIAEALGIRDPQRVKVWLRVYRREGTAAFLKPTGRPRKRTEEQGELQRLRMENALLKKFRTELRGVQLAKRNIG